MNDWNNDLSDEREEEREMCDHDFERDQPDEEE